MVLRKSRLKGLLFSPIVMEATVSNGCYPATLILRLSYCDSYLTAVILRLSSYGCYPATHLTAVILKILISFLSRTLGYIGHGILRCLNKLIFFFICNIYDKFIVAWNEYLFESGHYINNSKIICGKYFD